MKGEAVLKRGLLAALLSMTFLVLAQGNAWAEGWFSSSISGGRVGFESRSWTDRNLDNTNGSVVFSGCSRNVEIGVYHEYSFTPDVEVMRDTLYCTTYTDQGYFGDRAAGSYHFTIKRIINGTSVNVNYVQVNY